MLLRASGEIDGSAVDVRAVVDDSAAEGAGVTHAPALLALADAVVKGGDATLAAARDGVRLALGPEGLVDAIAVASNFERMVRIADATGIPLDAPAAAMSADLRGPLDLDRFGSAANTPPLPATQRAIGRTLRPFARYLFAAIGALQRLRQ